jgi:hypothetical protein
MKKPLGCFSVYGLLVSLLALVLVGVFTLRKGAILFSPGPLTAARREIGPLLGYASHAELEFKCTLCHRPWEGVDEERCLACHTGVKDQIVTQAGLHGILQDARACIQCHSEHQGRKADITDAGRPSFPHEQVGFWLGGHQRLADGTPFACANCHTGADYTFESVTCLVCHRGMDAHFADPHVAAYGSNCLSCHKGDPALSAFDHQALFALDGAHAALLCQDCHTGRPLEELSTGCIACHAEPELHDGRFSVDCEACHTTSAWRPARLRYHTFLLDHGSEGDVACQVCHPDEYVTYTCYGCHYHEPAQTERQHRGKTSGDITDCARCHPTGKETLHD